MTLEEIKHWIKVNQKGLIVGLAAGLLIRSFLR